MAKQKRYFTLLQWETRNCCQSAISKIIATGDTQDAINSAIARLNGGAA